MILLAFADGSEPGKIQDTGIVAKRMPTILDMDVAGEVYEVGPDIQDFNKGDRVLA